MWTARKRNNILILNKFTSVGKPNKQIAYTLNNINKLIDSKNIFRIVNKFCIVTRPDTYYLDICLTFAHMNMFAVFLDEMTWDGIKCLRFLCTELIWMLVVNSKIPVRYWIITTIPWVPNKTLNKKLETTSTNIFYASQC